MKNYLWRMLVIVFVVGLVLIPKQVSAAEEENAEVSAIEEYSSYDDYVVKQLSDGAWVRIDYTIITDGSGEHVVPGSITISKVTGLPTIDHVEPNSVFIISNAGGACYFSFYAITTITGSLITYYLWIYY